MSSRSADRKLMLKSLTMMIDGFKRGSLSLPVPLNRRKNRLWWRLFIFTLFSSYFYVLMEWLFFVTKPSFMDVMATGKKLDLMLSSGAFLLPLWLPALLLMWGLSYLPWLSKRWYFFLYAACLLPALVLSITTLLLIDNFTYTVFQVGIVTSLGIARLAYMLIYLLILVLWYRWVVLWLTADEQPRGEVLLVYLSEFGIGILLLSGALNVPRLLSLDNLGSEVGALNSARRPNILIIGSDGLNADHTSLYGYDRDTTPNLRHIADDSLLAENAFVNSGNTSGSIISIFNSKLPTVTRLMYPPDILRGSDSYQHLPGILRSLGYRGIEISTSHYIDAYTLNLRDGFDIVNERSLDQAGFQIFNRSTAFQDTGYFLSVLAERVSDRLLHITFIREMSNPYLEVTGEQLPNGDQYRVRKLINILKEAEQPLFVHVHLMVTHGDKFPIKQQVFSAGQVQDYPWMTDFYDDAVLEFDDNIGDVLSELTKLGVLENTILVIYSDHGQQYFTDRRVPLLIRFPGGEYAGRIRKNVQNMDIAPTLLEYLGQPVPGWMEGESLLAGEPDPLRPIFSTGIFRNTLDEQGYYVVDESRSEAPFYQFGFLQAIICQNWYRMGLKDYTWEQGEVSGHSAACPAAELPDAQAVQMTIIERLAGDGFDVADLGRHFTAGEQK